MSKPAAPEPSPPVSFPRALAWTAAPLIVYLLAARVMLPGVDEESLRAAMKQSWVSGGSLSNLSIAALGVTPIVSASILVELVALAVPSLRHLRHGGPEGRRKLGKAAAILGLVLAAFQAFGIARLVATLPYHEHVSSPMIVGTLVAATAGLTLLCDAATRRGLASGVGVLFLGAPLLVAVERLAARSGPLAPPLGAAAVAGVLAQIAAVALATWFVLERCAARGARSEGTATYRVPAAKEGDPGAPAVTIPAPASGLWPLGAAGALLAGPGMLAPLWPGAGGLSRALEKVPFNVSMALLLVVLGALAALFFNQPPHVAAVMARARSGAARAELEAEARARLRPAAVDAIAYLLFVYAITVATNRISHAGFPSDSTALATAFALDLLAERRARRAGPELVPVWPEHRPYALAAARAALEAAGIRVLARGERLRRLLQLFGPFVPIDLMVPRERAAEAAEILEGVLRERRNHPLHDDEPEEAPRRRVATKAIPLGKPALGAIVATVFALVALEVAGSRPAPSRRAPRATALELVSVDDDRQIVADEIARAPSPADLPRGLTFALENAPLGPGKSAPRFYARMVRGEHETMAEARARLVAWTATLALPEGDRAAAGELSEYDDEQDRFEPIGWRTYLLKGAPVLTAADVADATAIPDDQGRGLVGWTVRLELKPDGAKRFEEHTGANVKRRFAILLDGRVVSAPVIQARIPGGLATVTMGSGSAEQQRLDAQNLVEALVGR